MVRIEINVSANAFLNFFSYKTAFRLENKNRSLCKDWYLARKVLRGTVAMVIDMDSITIN